MGGDTDHRRAGAARPDLPGRGRPEGSAYSGNLDRIQIVKGWLDCRRVKTHGTDLRCRLVCRRSEADANGSLTIRGRQHGRRRQRHLDKHHRRRRS